MKTQITCPHCKTSFPLEDAIGEELEQRIRSRYEKERQEQALAFAERNRKLEAEMAQFEEKKKRENELFLERIKKEKEQQRLEIETELRKQIEEQQQLRLQALQKENEEKSQQLKQMQHMELELMRMNKKLQEQQEEEAFKLQKQKLTIEQELKEKLSLEILQRERERHDLEKRELEKQIHDQRKLTEQMRQKLEQGSMQTQGEVQELALEEVLQSAFPFDRVSEIGKGRKGADCILIIRNETGQECGSILFESKRTKEFDKKWLSKLKDDLLEARADIPVLVSQALPEDVHQFDRREGVWICRFSEVVAVVKVLREGLLNVARARRSEENKGEKKEMLYQYFSSNEFLQHMRAINEAYLFLKTSIDRERFQMEKIWKEREKQIDKVLLNNAHLEGSIRGITGQPDEDHLLEES